MEAAFDSTSIAKPSFTLFFLGLLLLFANSVPLPDNAKTHSYDFVVQATKVKRLCNTHNSITVNGQFPGPTLEVNNGDTLVINVVNRARYNVTIHWHGIRQIRTAWADGPEFVTQCPITPGASYTYRFTITGQEGTLWWHAHSSWLRATVYGAIIIHPKEGSSYPFPKPTRETPLLLGEWWDANPMDVIAEATRTGGSPNISDAYTINDTVIVPIGSGETNLLRVINAGLNQQLFFTVANHKLTVVGADASYLKPFTTDTIMLGPGQTTDVIITADQLPARYYIAAHAYASAQGAPFDNTTTTAVLEYKTAPCPAKGGGPIKPINATLPVFNDTATATKFTTSLRSPSKAAVPTEIDESFFSLLQAHQQGIPGVFTTDFPASPPVKFDYTGNVSQALWSPVRATKVYELKFGSQVEVVLQGTSIFTAENHPVHLHGYDFYIVAEGFGNFNRKRDTAKFNLVDPPLRNTVSLPVGGWAVIRFVADNPVLSQFIQSTKSFRTVRLRWSTSGASRKSSPVSGLPVALEQLESPLQMKDGPQSRRPSAVPPRKLHGVVPVMVFGAPETTR
ncbi:hypothetical protein RHGRI_027671 [Rhododendron griersonianum]|uniref:laccase n=1 Tax=Rhododendron griersonianum TaxID=479676 RepID=A0AAV6J1W1_9ERIC|nr:hypothetical protein RHGRI_027671 [Rhododendron griersonianum]